MLTAGGVQFVVGCVLEGEQSIVGTGYGQEDLVELALGRPLRRAWVCWMTMTMARVRAATTVWKIVSRRAGNPAAMLTRIQVPAAVTAKIAARGRDAYRSTLDSHRLTRGLDSPRAGGGSATEPGHRG